MTGTVRALLVGIDAYAPPVNRLYGCVNDVRALERFLRGRLGDRLDLRTLLDAEATRDNVISAFREHLTPAATGDVALFVFDGHGTEEPAPRELADLEPSGRLQVLMCADSGRRVHGKLRRGIADKELALLIRDAAAGGAHVAVILDCCHSGSGTRDAQVRVRQWAPVPDAVAPEYRDLVLELAGARRLDDFLDGAVASWPRLAPALDHVALSACQSYQVAKEHADAGDAYGVFTHALLAALESAGPGTTYRDLLPIVRSHVERVTFEQTPVIHPAAPGGPADSLLLDGTVQRRDATFHVTPTAEGYEVDAGFVHGLRCPAGDEHFELTCTAAGGVVAGQVRATDVHVGRSRVEPIGWEPGDATYRAVISVVPLPPAVVTVDVSDRAPPGTADALGRAIATAGPLGTPSPHVRLADRVDDVAAPHIRIAVDENLVRLLRSDGTPLTSDVEGTGSAALRRAVALAEHVARWEQVRGLAVPGSSLALRVRLEVFAARPGEVTVPPGRDPLETDGAYELAYDTSGGEPVAPSIFVRLTNTTARHLHVALLDLTDQFACRSQLFPTERIAPGHTVAVWSGAPIPVSLPRGRRAEPGAVGRDWLKLIVSEADFDSSAFELPALDEPPVERPATRAAGSTLERLARRALTRDLGAGGPPVSAPEWATRTIPVVTRVP